jgi:hypothetical protein
MKGKTEKPGEKPVPNCSPQIPRGLTWARTQAAVVRGRRHNCLNHGTAKNLEQLEHKEKLREFLSINTTDPRKEVGSSTVWNKFRESKLSIKRQKREKNERNGRQLYKYSQSSALFSESPSRSFVTTAIMLFLDSRYKEISSRDIFNLTF